MRWGGLSTSGSMLGKNLNAEGGCTNGALSTILDSASLGWGLVVVSPPCLCSPSPVWLRVQLG